MYQNIIFDLGGVVVEFAPKKYLLDLLCDAKAEAAVESIVFESEEWEQLDLGLMTRQGDLCGGCVWLPGSRAGPLRCRPCWMTGCGCSSPCTAPWS